MLPAPLHTCVYRESRTSQVVYIHVHYNVYGLIDLSLCCIICSQIKKIRVLVAKPELLISCHSKQAAVRRVFHPRTTATAPRVKF